MKVLLIVGTKICIVIFTTGNVQSDLDRLCSKHIKEEMISFSQDYEMLM